MIINKFLAGGSYIDIILLLLIVISIIYGIMMLKKGEDKKYLKQKNKLLS